MRKTITIDSILGGWGQTQYQTGKTEIDSSIGIDPDLPVGSNTKTSGMAVPAQYADFSGGTLNSACMWLLTTPKGSTVYAYLANGKFIEYGPDFVTENLIGTVPTSSGNGAAYYNNYIYLAANTDISRYGPLDGSAALTNTVWTGATLGSQTAMTNQTYPSLRGVSMPNHVMHAHGDLTLYVADVIAGQGVLHKIVTAKGTSEGDTDDGSDYNVVDLPWGYHIADIEAWGLDIAILANQSTGTVIAQGKPGMFLWETTDTDSFYKGPINLPDSLGTALQNVNGELKIFTGNGASGMRISKYIGGELISDRAPDTEFLEDSNPPFAGAVEAFGGRMLWGGFTTYPENSACVWALGSKKGKLPMGIHNIVRASSANSTDQIATAVKFVEQADSIYPNPLVAWHDSSDDGIDRKNTSGTINSMWRTAYVNVGEPFSFESIRVPVARAVGANMEIVPVVGIDDGSSTVALKTINNTNYAGKRHVAYKRPNITALKGENNFYLEFNHGGTVPLEQLFPITVEIDTKGDQE